jgi:hypothetical protein
MSFFNPNPNIPVKIKCGHVNWDSVYPENTLLKILDDVIDPFKPHNLKKGTIVTVKKIEYKPNNSWLVCADNQGNLWNVRPRDTEIIDFQTEKVGRFRILAQEDFFENQKST